MRRAQAMGLIVAVGLMVMAGLALSAPVYAQTLFGATGRNSQFVATSDFYRIDPTTGTATLVGPMGFSSVSGMAFHPTTGVLYAVGFDGLTHVLLTIDKVTGVGTLVGPTNVFIASGCSSDRVSDISFRSDGTLYAYAETCDQLGVINTSTGAFTLVGATGQSDSG